MEGFDYAAAFSRNLGWVTEWEQASLRRKRVAIAGMGGVGGVHLLTLARLGIGAFHIADLDRFEIANFNRQVGATMKTLGQPKVDVLAGMAADINPEIEVRRFPGGITFDNIDEFLEGVDLYVDGLDFFVLDVRAEVFARCAARGIPAITAAPIGMGTGYLVFMPGGMSFEEYFGLKGLPPQEQALRFLVGLTPRAFQRSSLVDLSRIGLSTGRGPSTVIACQLCAGAAAAEALKILLGRGPVRAAPNFHQFDAYTGRWIIGRVRGGSRNLLQRLRIKLARRALGRLSRNPPPADPRPDAPVIERIVGAALWAPSGDNVQPWRFAIEGDDRLKIFVSRPDRDNVYEYDDGRPTLLSAGFLLESLRIAASRHGRRMIWTCDRPDGDLVISVEFIADSRIPEDPLASMLSARSVDRRRFRADRLRPEEKAELEGALGSEFSLHWFETPAERWRFAKLSARATDIRLRIPEAFRVHRRILDWERDFSPDRVPTRAVGMSALTRQVMRVLMGNWRWLDAANRYLGATLLARVELDLIPGMSCGAHIAVTRRAGGPAPAEPEAHLRTGQALQRLWLTATRLRLVMQPSLAPLCFAHYGQRGERFTSDGAAQRRAGDLAGEIDGLARECRGELLFLARIGRPTSTRLTSRSVRRPLSELTVPTGPARNVERAAPADRETAA